MLRFLIFISIYLTVYGGLHLYFYRRLQRGFVLQRRERMGVKVFLILMVFGPLMTRALEGVEWHAAAEAWALLVFGWMGLLFMAAAAFFFVDIVRLGGWLIRRIGHIAVPAMVIGWRPLVGGVIVLSTCASLYGYFAAREIRIERVVITTDKLPAGVEYYRLVQLTDIHLGIMTDAQWLARIVDGVNALQPDLIVTTGDIIDSRITSAEPYREMLARLQATDGKYAVAGNHEFFAGIDNSVGYMEKAGFMMLRGERAEVTPWLHLYGVDDREGRHSGEVREDHETPLLQASEPRAFNLLLKHQPVIREQSIGKFDLQLAGHVHQGQIFPFRLITWLVYPVAMGMSELGLGSRIYVSRGTGTWGPPIRVLAPPEITLFEFVQAK